MVRRQIDTEVVDGHASIVIESTLPPTSAHEALGYEGAIVLVFSHDAALARVVRTVSAGRYPIRIINEWSDLLHQVGSGAARIVLLDVDALSTNADEALAELNRAADWLVLVIAAKQAQAQDFMQFWSERRIHRLLIKPAAAGITRLLLESAFARFIELRELHENTDSMEIPAGLLAADEAPARARRKPLLAAVGAAALISVVMALWLLDPFNSGDSADTAREPVGPARARADEQQVRADDDAMRGAASEVPDSFDDLLQLGLAAESRGQIAEPIGDNALDYYRSILIQAPNHSVARERLNAILESLFVTAESQILDRDFVAAEQTLALIRRGDPPGTRLKFLSEQLAALSAESPSRAAAADPVARTNEADGFGPAATAAQAELRSVLTLAQLRLNEGRLAEPPGDSARDYLLRAVDLGLEGPESQRFAAEFARQAAGALPALLEGGQFRLAQGLLDAAGVLGADKAELAAFEARIAAGLAEQSRKVDESLHAEALSRIAAGRLFDSEDSAAGLLDRLRSRGADPALITDVEARLTNALAQGVREAITAQQWDEADSLLETFAAAGLDSAVASGLETNVAIARRQQRYLDEVAPVGELTVVRSRPAEYPRAARAAGVTGWVDVHFTVDRTGATRDIEIVGAEPAGAFEDVATAAVAEYEFVPFELDQHVYERRLRLRMRFELN